MCPYGRYELGARPEIAEKNVIRLNNYFYVVLIVYELPQKQIHIITIVLKTD